MGVQILCLGIDIEQPGDDLALGGVLLQKVLRAQPVMRICLLYTSDAADE